MSSSTGLPTPDAFLNVGPPHQSSAITRQSLETWAKPIRFVSPVNFRRGHLPRDVQDLFDRIHSIAVERREFIPRESRSTIEMMTGVSLADSWYKKTPEGRSTPQDWLADNENAFRLLDGLRNVQAAAHRCFALERSESSWTTEVHSPLLKAALRKHKNVESEGMQTARIAPAFVPEPRYQNAVAVWEKGVALDLALTLSPPPRETFEQVDAADVKYEKLQEAIRQFVLSQPAGQQTINQSLYPPLVYRPLAVIIATVLDRPAEAGRMQLAMWAAAWHGRFAALIDQMASAREREGRPSGKVPQILTLPLILVVEHQWHLSFACDGGDCLEIVGSICIGDTSNLAGLHCIAAVIQELASWIEGPFTDWFTHLLSRS